MIIKLLLCAGRSDIDIYLNEVIWLELNKEEICKGVGWGKDTNQVEYRTLGLGNSGPPSTLQHLKGQQSKGVTTIQEGKLHGEDLPRGTMVSERRGTANSQPLDLFADSYSLLTSQRPAQLAPKYTRTFIVASEDAKLGGGEKWKGGHV